MVSGKYSALAGAISREQALANISNNLANVSTTGYKKMLVSFESILKSEQQVGDANGINYNRISLPALGSQPDTTVHLLLLGPRLDLTFSRTLFFTLFTQYNTQYRNLNFNARLQWRYKPVSDLFVVYIDNYLQEGGVWQPYNRAIIVKLTYWLNI